LYASDSGKFTNQISGDNLLWIGGNFIRVELLVSDVAWTSGKSHNHPHIGVSGIGPAIVSDYV
jgi:hypothetical protein